MMEGNGTENEVGTKQASFHFLSSLCPRCLCGAPRARRRNGNTMPELLLSMVVAALLDNVQNFNLDYLTRTSAPLPRESAEQALCVFDTSGSATNVTATSWLAQYFKPALPANAVSWKITRILVRMQQGSSSGTIL